MAIMCSQFIRLRLDSRWRISSSDSLRKPPEEKKTVAGGNEQLPPATAFFSSGEARQMLHQWTYESGIVIFDLFRSQIFRTGAVRFL